MNNNPEIRVKAIHSRTFKTKTTGESTAAFTLVEADGEVDIDPKWNTFVVYGHIALDPKTTVQKMIIQAMPKRPGSGTMYVLQDMDLSLDLENENEVRMFLLDIINDNQYNNLTAVYPTCKEIVQAMEKGVDAIHVKGVRRDSAENIIKRYKENKEIAGVRGKLRGFMPEYMMRRALGKWPGPVAVKKITDDPYVLMQLQGVGFKRADEVYLRMGKDPKHPNRIRRLIIDTLEDAIEKGNSWIDRTELWREMVKKASGIEASVIKEQMIYMGKGGTEEIVISPDQRRIGLKKQSDIEKEICKHLIRIMWAKPMATIENLEESILETEKKVGYSFSDEQKEAAKLISQNNVFLLTGRAGVGKSSSSKVVTDAFRRKGYLVLGTALSGKAASVLGTSTGVSSGTMHRTLRFGSMEDPTNPDRIIMGFKYNERNPLPAQMVVLDEVSMVDTEMFLHLLKAMPTGCRLLMMGDRKQLRSLFVPVMYALLQSGCIPTIDLEKIHRQAEDSGVIVDAGLIREKKNPMPSERYSVVGKMQDLSYTNASADIEIPSLALSAFKKYLSAGADINDIQIITQAKKTVAELNRSCQSVYNPPSPLKKEVELGYETKQILREGDKVLCIKNNYKATNINTGAEGVFNGMVGVISKFEKDEKKNEEYMIVNFEDSGEFKIYRSEYGTLQLGYCITGHKSQGSGYKHVIVAMPFGYNDSLNWIYTAMTRTRLTCDIITQRSTMSRAVKEEQSSTCQSFLTSYLTHYFQNRTKIEASEGEKES